LFVHQGWLEKSIDGHMQSLHSYLAAIHGGGIGSVVSYFGCA